MWVVVNKNLTPDGNEVMVVPQKEHSIKQSLHVPKIILAVLSVVFDYVFR
jgi:hypothetical protein